MPWAAGRSGGRWRQPWWWVASWASLVERAIFRPLQGDVVSGFIATMGLMFVFEVLVGEIWGWGLSKPIPSPYMRAISFMGASVAFQRVLLIPFAVVSISAGSCSLCAFRLGRALRAVAQDPEAAALQGININKMTALALSIAGAYAGLAGGLMSTIYAVTPSLGGHLILPALIVVVVGGMGSIGGATLAAVIFGLCHDLCYHIGRRCYGRNGFGYRYGHRISHQTTGVNGPCHCLRLKNSGSGVWCR
jgi:branched-subunit amino acid ABC-type transport system permease component